LLEETFYTFSQKNFMILMLTNILAVAYLTALAGKIIYKRLLQEAMALM